MRPTLLALLMPLVACAPSQVRGDIGGIMPQLRGTMALQNSAGSLQLGNEMNNVDSNLGVGDSEPAPYLRLEADWGRHRVRASGFGFSSSGTGTLGGDFGDLPAGSAVSSSMQFFNISTAWSYDLLGMPGIRLGPGVQLGFYSLDVTVNAASPSGSEKVATDVLVPQPFLDGEIDIGTIIALQANAGLMSANLGDANGRYWDVEALVTCKPAPGFELIAGYRYILLNASGTATGRDFDANLDIRGFLLGGGIRF